MKKEFSKYWDNIGIKIIRYLAIILLGIYFYWKKELLTINSYALGIIFIIGGLSYFIYDLKRSYFYFYSIKDQESKMKSNKEKFIAGYLRIKKIKYVYEKPLTLGKNIVHPDFYLPEFDIYVEYWGRDKNEAYQEYLHKKQLYKDEGIRLINLYPDNLVSFRQLDWKFTERLLEVLKKVE